MAIMHVRDAARQREKYKLILYWKLECFQAYLALDIRAR